MSQRGISIQTFFLGIVGGVSVTWGNILRSSKGAVVVRAVDVFGGLIQCTCLYLMLTRLQPSTGAWERKKQHKKSQIRYFWSQD